MEETKKINARILKENKMYVGQIFGTWQFKYYGIPIGEKEKWRTVTKKCFTKKGALRELRKWKDENCPEEIQL